MQNHPKTPKNTSKTLKNKFGPRSGYIPNRPPRTRCTQSRSLNRQTIGENNHAPTVTLRVKGGVPCGAGFRVGRVPCGGFRVASAVQKSSKWTVGGRESCPVVVRMLWSAVSAFKRAYYRLQTRPDFDFLAVCSILTSMPSKLAQRHTGIRLKG